MSERVVVFDTNILPVFGGLDGTVWLSIRKLCEILDIDVVIPDIVVHEANNLRRTKYRAIAAKFLGILSDVGKYADLEPVYIPDEDEIANAWIDQLREVFTVAPVHPEDAVVALEREALRVRPARAGKGARDSAIWLTVLRLASEYQVVYFVSNNTLDFATNKRGDLHPDLVAESEPIQGEIRYLTSVHQFVAELANQVEIQELDAPAVLEVLQLDVRQGILAAIASDEHLAAELEDTPVEAVQFDAVQVKKAYEIADQHLLLIEVQCHIELTHEESPKFKATAWLDVDPESDFAVVGGEVRTIAPVDD